MDSQCYLCGCKKFQREAPDTVAQRAHITQRLEELANLRTANDDLRSCIGRTVPAESDLLAQQKAKYIKLLQKKELLLQRVHKGEIYCQTINFNLVELRLIALLYTVPPKLKKVLGVLTTVWPYYLTIYNNFKTPMWRERTPLRQWHLLPRVWKKN